MSLSLSIAVRDLDAAIDALDADNNRALTWGEIRQAMPAIEAWVTQGIGLRCDRKTLDLRWAFQSLEQRSDGVYARLGASAPCPPQAALALDYQLMKGLDPTHRLLVGGTLHGQPMASVLAPHAQASVSLRNAAAGPGAGAAGQPVLGLVAAQSVGAIFKQFFAEGVHHIATGYDHLAFLLALVLPIMLGKKSTAMRSMPGERPGLGALVRTVTGFTIGHCLTLVMASLGWIKAPGWIEPAIAITIAITALLNLYPLRWVRSDVLALVFGLIHGIAFSEVIREAGISGASLLWALAGFNLGVEAGQLVGVLLWCALHLLLVRWAGYERWVMRGGSWALLLLALGWTVQRLI